MTDTGLVATLVAESEALSELLEFWTLAPLLALAAVGVASYQAVAHLVRRASKAGYDAQRRLAVVRIATAAIATLWVGDVVARYVLVRAPILGTLLVVLFLGGVLFGAAVRVQDALGGLLLVMRGRIREGDRLTLGEVSGIVEHAGLSRIRLRGSDGVAVLLPVRLLDRNALGISSPQRAQPVRVSVERPHAITGPEREALRRVALLCPYRQADSPLTLTTQPDPRRLELQLLAWSDEASLEAETWLRERLKA